MDVITAEQAAEAAKGLTFEKVWAALMENRQQMQESQKQMQESQKETQKQMQESQKETQKQMQESQKQMQVIYEQTQKEIKDSQQRTDKTIAEFIKNTDKTIAEFTKNTDKTIAELTKNTDKTIKELSKNIGGLGNSLGRLTEVLFSAGLLEKFNKLGYPFTKQSPNVIYHHDNKVLAEVDYLLENGEYAMPVEVKTELTADNVNDHLQRMERIRQYFDMQGEKRKLVGAVAGGYVNDSVLKYAQKQGLYVIIQTGDAVAIADLPPDFKAREW